VRSRIVRLVDLTTRQMGGSAVKIRIADRYFLATAAHVIPSSHDIRALIPGTVNEFVAGFRRWECETSFDVGFLEISSMDAGSLGDTFVFEDEISTHRETETLPLVVAGYPGQLIHSTDERILANAVAKVHDFRSLVFFTEAIQFSQWPNYLELPAQQEADVFAGFDPMPQLHKLKLDDISMPPENVSISSLHLGGMSGGGIWKHCPSRKDNAIWQPNLKLIALDVSFSPDGKWLRGSLISKWLDLLHERYRDLRESIQSIRDRE